MIITITTQKGGVGKTATAAALTQAATHSGRRCLAIDADSQANFTTTLGADPEPGTYNLITGQPAEIQTTAQEIDVFPASWDLATITSTKGSARRLKRRLEPLRSEYDYIFIDTPPGAGEMQFNAIMAADLIILPAEADSYNLTALTQDMNIIRRIRPDVPAGLVITDYDARTKHGRQLQEVIINYAASLGVSFYGLVRHSVAVKEAATMRESLFTYAPRSNAAADYMKIWQKIDGNE